MADSLYLSMWFPSFEPEEMLARTTMVLRQFPYSASEQGVTYVSVHPIGWAEPTVLERRLKPPMAPEAATEVVTEFAKPDFAIRFECYWDLWVPDANQANWVSQPMKVEFVAHGTEFEEGVFQERGHIEVDFGLDHPFLYEELDLDEKDEEKVKANIAKLVNFTQKIEQNANVTGRVLWSESEENLAQKLIARLQRVN